MTIFENLCAINIKDYGLGYNLTVISTDKWKAAKLAILLYNFENIPSIYVNLYAICMYCDFRYHFDYELIMVQFYVLFHLKCDQ